MTGMADRPGWLCALNGNPIAWLLQKSNPCVRYRAQRELLELPDDNPEVVERWKGDYDEIGITLQSPDESARLRPVMQEALDTVTAGLPADRSGRAESVAALALPFEPYVGS